MMTPNDYLTYSTVCELGETNYTLFRQAIKQRGYSVSPLSGQFSWTVTTDVDYDPNTLCIFLDDNGDLSWGEIDNHNLAGQEITLAQALAMINKPQTQLSIESLTVGEVKAKIAELEQQLEATNAIHQQQVQELTEWRTAVRVIFG